MSAPKPYATARTGIRTRLADRFSLRARRRRLELFEQLLDPKPGESAVDIGCGTAGLATTGTALEVTGVDRDPRPGYPGARFVQADATGLPFADSEFDIAYSNSVVEHLPPERSRGLRGRAHARGQALARADAEPPVPG